MSGPNDPYDPKQVSALSAESLDAMVADAVAAFAAATTVAHPAGALQRGACAESSPSPLRVGSRPSPMGGKQT